MKKQFIAIFAWAAVLFSGCCVAGVGAITVNQALVNRVAQLAPDDSNAQALVQLFGQPAACLPTSTRPSEAWVCQWKGNPKSARLVNTLNVTFEAGMITQIVGIDAAGNYFSANPGQKVDKR